MKLSTVVRVNNSPGNIAGARVSKASGTESADDLSNPSLLIRYFPFPPRSGNRVEGRDFIFLVLVLSIYIYIDIGSIVECN